MKRINKAYEDLINLNHWCAIGSYQEFKKVIESNVPQIVYYEIEYKEAINEIKELNTQIKDLDGIIRDLENELKYR